MKKAYKFRIEPNTEQVIQLAKTFGCVRFVWNYMLHMRQQEYRLEGMFPGKEICSEALTELKKTSGYEWLKEADSIALQATLEHQLESYKRFFKREGGMPHYKAKKEHKDSYTTKAVNGNIRISGNRIFLPKLGAVKIRLSRQVEGKIQRATISRKPSGKYYISILCEAPDAKKLPEGKGIIGIDVGITDLAVLNDGTKYPGPHALKKALKKLKHEQLILSRKTSGSKRFEVQRIKVARLQEHIANIRNDYAQKLSTELIRKYDTIAVEDLKIMEMLKSADHNRARGIMDSGWRSFVTMLEYKAEWYGRKLIKVDTYYPSTQLCHVCGYKNEALKDPSIRKWKCPECGKTHDRDINAAINIKTEAIRMLKTAS